MAKKEKLNVKSVDKNLKGNVTSKSFCGCRNVLLILAIVSVLLSIAAFQVYSYCYYIPELPAVDLNENWGPKGTVVKDTSIRPFKVVFTDSMQEETRTLFEYYRRGDNPKSFNETGWSYGINSEGFPHFFTEWIFDYCFRKRAKFLNKFNHYKTNIQGLDMHFIHVKPKVDTNVEVVPILLLHGWPGSIREFYETIPRLTAPREGYNFVFEVIVPSLPGFIYSQAPARPGLSPLKIAVIIRNLMHRIGHKTYYIQGGDLGHVIGSHIATLFPKEVLGFHTNLPVNFSNYAFLTWILGSVWPSFVAGEEIDKMYPVTDKIKFFLEEFGYLHLQATKPDTIGIALQDSPVGLASYILDRMMIFTDPANKELVDGGLTKYYSTDKLIDNIMLYWASKSITTAMRLYKESVDNREVEQVMSQIPTPVPTWILRLKHELVHQPDFLIRWKYPTLVGSSSLDYGGHFAAFERPKTFADNVFQAVKAFRREIPTPVPTWILRLKHELVHQPDFLIRWKYPTLVGSSSLDYGGHFAAFERPKTFADNVFQAVKAFRRE